MVDFSGATAQDTEPDACDPIVAAPGDTVVAVRTTPLPARCGPPVIETIYVAVHRRFGAWTHVYSARRALGSVRGEVRLVRVLEGDRLAEACRWAREDGVARDDAARTSPLRDSGEKVVRV